MISQDIRKSPDFRYHANNDKDVESQCQWCTLAPGRDPRAIYVRGSRQPYFAIRYFQPAVEQATQTIF